MRISTRALVLTTALSLAVASSASAADPVKSDNVRHIANFRYDGGGELAAQGRYIYSGEANAVGGGQRNTKPEDGGLHIYDVKTMKELSFLHCPGTDNDIEVVKPGLVAMAFSNNLCANQVGEGLMLIDVSNARKPRVISSLTTNSAHTMKTFPGGDYIYMAGGNTTGSLSAGTVIVDVRNPLEPKIATTAVGVMDCHDVSFRFTKERKLAFCAGAVGTGEVQIWDVADPLAPTMVGRIVNPAIQYSHYAVANHDATLLAIDDEAFVAHDCNTGASPTGRVWIYDITDPSVPVPVGSVAPPRGGDPANAGIGHPIGWVASWCMSHGLDFHPTKDAVAVTWFTGGVSVIEVSGQSPPVESAYFQAEDSMTYSALWHAGYLWTNDHMRGVDALEIEGY